ncbi:hypothetical protein E2C01_003750 [Portunus trituberculatus]|uniref:Uncharacterized protein n=1 Tax=Portunus trituberculatus TaxID=210409 RepID=A0A5B7CN70_PORTR|nr:hypothetical protein [Portunus trituberculatus]
MKWSCYKMCAHGSTKHITTRLIQSSSDVQGKVKRTGHVAEIATGLRAPRSSVWTGVGVTHFSSFGCCLR